MRWIVLLGALILGCKGSEETTELRASGQDAAVEDALVTDEDAPLETSLVEPGADVPPTPECSPIADPSGCPEDETCVFSDLSANWHCVARGTVPIGGECGGVDRQCESGGCLNLAGAGFRCYKYCTKKLHCPKDSDCMLLSGKNFGVCKLTQDVYEDLKCDLLKQDCKEGQGCYRTNLASFPICQPAGLAVQGEPCTAYQDCARGYTCNGNACAKVCNATGGEPGCDAGYECKLPYGLGIGLCSK